MSGPDFSHVDSLEKATALCEEGVLEEVLLLPAEFGGPKVRENVTYLPRGFGALKARVDQNIVTPLIRDGAVTRYEAAPEYEGNSVVPVALRIRAWDPRDFSTKLRIWGSALDA